MVSDGPTGASILPAPTRPPQGHRRRWPRRGPGKAEHDVVAAAQRGGVRERQQLIQDFLPLIVNVARRYQRSASIDTNELMQEGCVGLLQALRHYNPDLGVPFGAYARWWVRRAIQQLVCELTGPVVLSERAVRQLTRVKRARREFEQTRGRPPQVGELADGCALPSAQVASLIAADLDARTLSLPAAEPDGEGRAIASMLIDPRSEEAYEATIWRLTAAQLPRMLDRLGERERRVIRARYGLECTQRTRGELAGELCVSAERVRQIEQAAMRKLNAACEETPERAQSA
jgi:RNA polymerase sigma factor (sigma-70 family)